MKHNLMVEETLDLFEKHRRDYLESARDVAEKLASDGKLVTVDDIRKECPIPDGIDARVLGGVFREKKWEKVGHKYSTRVACHKSNRMVQYKLRIV